MNKEDIINDYQNSSLTIREICNKYGVSSKTVSRLISEYGLKPRATGQVRSQKSNGDIYVRYIKGSTINELAEAFDMSTGKVRSIITNKRRDAVLKQYRRGLSVERIAENNKISVARIYQILEENVTPLRQPQKAAERANVAYADETVVEEYRCTDLTTSEICKRHHISSATLNKIIKRNNVPLRKIAKISKAKRDAVTNAMSMPNADINEISERCSLNPETVQKIIDEESFSFEGENIKNLVNAYAKSLQSISALCRKFGVKRVDAEKAIRNSDAEKRRKSCVKKALKKYKNGMSAEIIAAGLGVSTSTFYRLVAKERSRND